MKYFLLAGEKSGDLHAGNLAKELYKKDNLAEIEGWGGEVMRESGVKVLQDYSGLAFMGLDFVTHLGSILRLYKNCKNQIESFNPDVLILVDYSGFNLRIAKWAKRKSLKIIYYTAPKTWAWNASRNKTIKKYVDRLLVILPFEEKYFSSKGISTSYVGNPVLDQFRKFRADPLFENSIGNNYNEIVALLPGSRKKELLRVSEKMKYAAKHFKDTLFIVAGISELDRSLYQCFESIKNCQIVFDKTYDLLNIADAAVVTSGTATLETALFNVPQVMVYKAGKLTYFIGSRLVKIKYFSLVNLILEKIAIPELIQGDFNGETIVSNLRPLLKDTKTRKKQLDNYKNLRNILGNHNASEKAAQSILAYIK